MAKRGKKKRKVVFSKAQNQYRHTEKRFVHRYGVNINRAVYDDLCRQIRENKAQFISKTSNRVSLFWVKLGDERYPVVYDRVRKTIATVLLREWLDESASQN